MSQLTKTFVVPTIRLSTTKDISKVIKNDHNTNSLRIYTPRKFSLTYKNYKEFNT